MFDVFSFVSSQVEINPTFKNLKTASKPSPSCSQFHLYYDTTEEQYSLSENHSLKTKPLERASVLRTPCSQLINKEQMNSRKRWVTHMQDVGATQTFVSPRKITFYFLFSNLWKGYADLITYYEITH